MRRVVSLHFLVFSCLALLLMSKYAFSDTDYRCLDLCIKSGKKSHQCMSSCSYESKAIKNKRDAVPGHGILPELQRLDRGAIIVDSAASKEARKSTDYKCLSLCLQSKIQYEMCHDSCTVKTEQDGHSIGVDSNQFKLPSGGK